MVLFIYREYADLVDQAFRTSQEVFLIFGANRSGEFFGYAQMVAPSVRPKASDRQSSLLRSSYSSISSMGGLAAPGPRLQLSQPTPIREEGESPLRSATDPYYRRQSTAWLAAGTRAASPGALDEEDELEGEYFSPKIEVGHFRSDSPDALEEGMRRISVNTLDPNLLRERRESSRVFRMSHMEQSNSLQIPLTTSSLNVHRKESLAVPGPGRKDSVASAVVEPPAPARPGAVAEPADDTLALPFRLKWVKVAPLSFFRTRHLRNPWNGDREVKVSRDGTELEPSGYLFYYYTNSRRRHGADRRVGQARGRGGGGGRGGRFRRRKRQPRETGLDIDDWTRRGTGTRDIHATAYCDTRTHALSSWDMTLLTCRLSTC